VYDGTKLWLYYTELLNGTHCYLDYQTTTDGVSWTAKVQGPLDIGTSAAQMFNGLSVIYVASGSPTGFPWTLFYSIGLLGSGGWQMRTATDPSGALGGPGWSTATATTFNVLAGYKLYNGAARWNATKSRFEMLAYDVPTTWSAANPTVGGSGLMHAYTSTTGATWNAVTGGNPLVEGYMSKPCFIVNSGGATIDMWYALSPGAAPANTWAIQYSPAIPQPFDSYTPRMRQLHWSYESGSTEEFFTGIPSAQTIASDTGQHHDGAASLKVTSGTLGAYASAFLPASVLGKTLRVWFYDDNLAGASRMYLLRLHFVNYAVGINSAGAGVWGGNSTTNYSTVDSTNTYATITGKTRSVGWHSFDFTFTTSTTVSLLVDNGGAPGVGTPNATLTFTGQPQFLSLSTTTISGQIFYVDDIGIAVSTTCPDAPVGADPSAACKFVSQLKSPSSAHTIANSSGE
jgi:hypothetical protein